MFDALIIFISIFGCADYDPQYWQVFNDAMLHEWQIRTVALCYSVDEFPEGRQGHRQLLASWNINGTYFDNVVFLTNPEDGDIFKSKITRGVALFKEDIAFVKNRLKTIPQYGITTNHEILHLVLENAGKSERCYSKLVHGHADDVVAYSEKVSIMDYFSCARVVRVN